MVEPFSSVKKTVCRRKLQHTNQHLKKQSTPLYTILWQRQQGAHRHTKSWTLNTHLHSLSSRSKCGLKLIKILWFGPGAVITHMHFWDG